MQCYYCRSDRCKFEPAIATWCNFPFFKRIQPCLLSYGFHMFGTVAMVSNLEVKMARRLNFNQRFKIYLFFESQGFFFRVLSLWSKKKKRGPWQTETITLSTFPWPINKLIQPHMGVINNTSSFWLVLTSGATRWHPDKIIGRDAVGSGVYSPCSFDPLTLPLRIQVSLLDSHYLGAHLHNIVKAVLVQMLPSSQYDWRWDFTCCY